MTKLKNRSEAKSLTTSFEMMLQIRYFEDEVKNLFSSGTVRGSTHLCQGQEAVVVGVCSMLNDGDTMTCTYRGHGAVIAMGASLKGGFGELLGRSGGLCGGKGGSMHFADFQNGALGSNAIVGAQIPIAVGAGLAAEYLGNNAVTVTFTGDGSTNIGAFHESMNLAAIWKLPVIFVIENNQYGEYSPMRSTTPIDRLVDRAASYGMPGVTVDGMDVLAVQSVAETAIARAREGGGPTLIEAQTYRFEGHSRSDPAKYRPAGELEAWMKRDPIVLAEKLLIESGELTADGIKATKSRIKGQVDDALNEALAFPDPSIEELSENVYQ